MGKGRGREGGREGGGGAVIGMGWGFLALDAQNGRIGCVA